MIVSQTSAEPPSGALAPNQHGSKAANASTVSSSGYARELLQAVDFTPVGFALGREKLEGASWSLQGTRDKLEATIQNLTDELLSLINRDHQMFLELSSDLIRVDSTVTTLRGPLGNIRERVEKVRKAANGPVETAASYDERIRLSLEKEAQIKRKISAQDLRLRASQDIDRGLLERAAQRIALLAHEAESEEDVEASQALKRSLEQKLSTVILGVQPISSSEANSDTVSDSLDEKLRALAVLGGFDTLRRNFISSASASSHASHSQSVQAVKSVKTVLEAMVTPHELLMSRAMNYGLDAQLDLANTCVWPTARSAGNELVSIQDAKDAEALRLICSSLSVSGNPKKSANTVRWNPRMHCELRYQAAQDFLSANPTKLERAVEELYQDAHDMASHDDVLAAKLLRMHVRLLMHYLSLFKLSEDLNAETEATLLEKALLVGALARELSSASPKYFKLAPEGWAEEPRLRTAVLSAALAESRLLADALSERVVSKSLEELTAHEQEIIDGYRGCEKAPPTSASESCLGLFGFAAKAASAVYFPQPGERAAWLARTAARIALGYKESFAGLVDRESELLKLLRVNVKREATNSGKIVQQMKLDSRVIHKVLLRALPLDEGSDDGETLAKEFQEMERTAEEMLSHN